ncbi:hypothetical protein Arub01_39210 [Actinomadura rubrobrunea]|uniref:Uncharacterized protein n=1 Tax=Actinomadura rubrobrunea TaxID=115335 RepID=A0A9W6PXN6_9ACTN|nr:hypothetical protein [Actinomadura rubrobrunea]GLW65677.1 hypothetical protein Arub01_39210 [Actinomadura rubrobrunea]
MTERRPGAPEPADPFRRGDASASAAPTGDLTAVRRTDAVFEALARRAAASASAAESAAESARAESDRADADRADSDWADSDCADSDWADSDWAAPASAAEESARAAACQDPDAELDERLRAVGAESDPAVRLLRALVADVGDQGPDRQPGPEPPPGPRRRGRRTIVALGVAGAVLASGGVAAAGGDLSERSALGAEPGKGVAQRRDDPSAEAHRQTLRPATRPRAVGAADAGRDRGAPRTTARSSPSAPSRSTQDEKRRADRAAETPTPARPTSGTPSSGSPDGTLATRPPSTQPSVPVTASPTPGPWLILPPSPEELQRRIEEIRRRFRGHAERSGLGDKAYSSDAHRDSSDAYRDSSDAYRDGESTDRTDVEGNDPKPYLP